MTNLTQQILLSRALLLLLLGIKQRKFQHKLIYFRMLKTKVNLNAFREINLKINSLISLPLRLYKHLNEEIMQYNQAIKPDQ